MKGTIKMIEFTKVDLLKADTDALVNTVNCVGVMGKGIALQFKEGLVDLKEKIKTLKIKSIAIPPLGAGLGGLNWPEVKDLIVNQLSDLDGVKIAIYEPAGSPAPGSIQIRTQKPKMTNGRAILLNLLQYYKEPGYKLTLLEIQKLMYFVQEAGESLRLKYTKEKYGPYASNLEHVLQKIEGHFIRGCGDRTGDSSIRLLKEGLEISKEFLKDKPGALDRLKKVAKLIRGFETPYGLELLSTVHWTIKHENKKEKSEIIDAIREWNKRKRNLFLPHHIQKTLKHLKSQEML